MVFDTKTSRRGKHKHYIDKKAPRGLSNSPNVETCFDYLIKKRKAKETLRYLAETPQPPLASMGTSELLKLLKPYDQMRNGVRHQDLKKRETQTLHRQESPPGSF
jgi:hypothetical protein